MTKIHMPKRRGNSVTRRIINIIRQEICPNTSGKFADCYCEEHDSGITDSVNAQLINPDTKFENDLQMGPEYIAEIFLAISEHFSIELPDNAVETTKNIKELSVLVKQCAKDQGVDICR
jgi:acyl carrier protein